MFDTMFETPDWLEKLVADPTVQKPDILYIPKLRSLAAKGSAGEGAVVATVNGYGALVKIRIARELIADLPRLGRLVQEAVNRATVEAERLRPPPPLPPLPFFGDDLFDLIPDTPLKPVEPRKLPVVRSLELGYSGYIPTHQEPGYSAFRDAAARVRMLIFRDYLRHPKELRPLFSMLAFDLGSRPLTAARIRRMLPDEGPNILRRFRRDVGVSLTEYIQWRQGQLAAKLFYRSGLPAAEVAELLGFDDEAALVEAVEESDLAAFCDNVASIRSWISRDSFRRPTKLLRIFQHVERNIHRPDLTAASVSRFLRPFREADHPDILKEFRRFVGISLTAYILRRRAELAARMAYTSDMPLSKIVEYLGFANDEVLRTTIEQWSGGPIEDLRKCWQDLGMDCVVWQRVETGQATQDDLDQFLYEFERLYPEAMKRFREDLAEQAVAAEEGASDED